MRRKLIYDSLQEAVLEAETLLSSGYTRSGNWSLAQVCRHLRLTIESNVRGYPGWMTILGYPLRPVLRAFLLPRLLDGRSPSGVRTAKIFVPPDDLVDADEVLRFERCVAEFENSDAQLHSHPGFGAMSKAEFSKFHAAHAGHHLSFLWPRQSADDKA
ncbi:hypothetical protein Pla175_25200 [Pirellulimonas nuda]|uniref:DUF1569 domain-containing protein n=2 Tax=Pirellulimonas nuda TaxID=2528009 RepID=A0A518DCE2_9BACT|nr:hypothetical protein Pla175_25200 [Pirellulimonas nuda]